MAKISKFESEFLGAAGESLALYREHGARSPCKLHPVHGCIAAFVLRELGEGYEVKSLGIGDNKEATVGGQYYDKKVDITVAKNGRDIAVVSFKFVTSNYKQNSVNYFEHMLGETANLRRKNIGFAHVFILRGDMPYLSRGGKVKKVEKITGHNLDKYIRLFKDCEMHMHRPDLLAVALVTEDNGKVRFCESDDALGLPAGTVKLLRGELSLANFARKFPLLCKIKE